MQDDDQAVAAPLSAAEMEKLHVTVFMPIKRRLLEDFALEPTADVACDAQWLSDAIVMRVRQAVFGQHLKYVERRWPADWWQAVKDRWFPAWALRLRLVQVDSARPASGCAATMAHRCVFRRIDADQIVMRLVSDDGGTERVVPLYRTLYVDA